MKEFSVVGRPEPRTEGKSKVSGAAIYTADRALQNLAWGKVVRSPLPHARIASIDASAARKIPGVLAVLTAHDVSSQRFGRHLRDMPILAQDRVRFIGEKVAAIAAETPAIAEEAASLVDVEYDELPAIFDSMRAMQEGAPILHEDLASYPNAPRPLPALPNVHSHVKWRLGDCQRGFAESDVVFEQTFTTQRIHQGYLEPHACIVRYDPKGRISLWASNKVPFQTRQYLAEVLAIEPAEILFQLSPVGGDFGGKGSLMDIPLAYYLSRATSRPIKMVMSYGEELSAGNPRHRSTIRIKSGVKMDGTLWAREVKMVFNSGAYAAFKPNATINLPGARHAAGAYRIPHVSVEALSVYTNTVPSGHMRGPGDPQVYFAIESHTDYIARKLKIDPLDFRRRNVLRAGDVLPAGDRVDTDTGKKILKRISTNGSAPGRRGKLLRGQGISLCLRDIGPGEANIEVGLNSQGKVAILTTVTDTGAGAHTMLRQVVAEAIGTTIEDVEVISGDTDSFDTDIALGGSRVTYLAGKAATLAAEKLRARIIETAAVKWHCSAAVINIVESVVVGLRGNKLSFIDIAGEPAADGRSWKELGHFANRERKGTLSYFAQLADVEIDAETGRLTLLKITCLNDVGTIINPLHHQGQVEGGMIQGLGFTLLEDLPDLDGRIAATNLGEYKIPNVRDVPRLETVNVHDSAGPGPFQSKPIGENTGTPTAAAIANAVYDALGIQIKDLPITSEKIYFALKRGAVE
jgi:CO/xanthine dehydrogenase Mo-binding subunit